MMRKSERKGKGKKCVKEGRGKGKGKRDGKER